MELEVAAGVGLSAITGFVAEKILLADWTITSSLLIIQP